MKSKDKFIKDISSSENSKKTSKKIGYKNSKTAKKSIIKTPKQKAKSSFKGTGHKVEEVASTKKKNEIKHDSITISAFKKAVVKKSAPKRNPTTVNKKQVAVKKAERNKKNLNGDPNGLAAI